MPENTNIQGMRRRSKRRLHLALAVLATSSLALTACGGGDGGGESAESEAIDLSNQSVGAMEDFGVGDTFVATEDVEFSLLYRDHPNYPYNENWLFFEELKEKNKVSFDVTTAPLSDWAQRRSLLIGSGDAPEIIPITYPGDETPYIAGGALLPVSDYLDYMPNFTDKIEKWGLESNIDALRQEDGKFYVLPGIHEQPRAQYSIAVRGDIWDEMGFEDPQTWDEFAEQLAAVKEKYPDAIPYSDRWSLNGPIEATISAAAPNFGTKAGWGYADGMQFDADADQFEYAGASDEYRDLVGYFAGLVEDGLMDPESLTQEDDQAIQKFASGKSLAIGANDQELLTYRKSLEEVGQDGWEVRMISVPAGPAGNYIEGGSQTESGLVISSKAAEQEDFKAMLQFIDWLYYSDEGLEFAKWGVEGETYTKAEDGTRTLAEGIDINGLNPGAEKALNTDFGFHNGVFMLAHGSTTDLAQSMLRPEVIEWQDKMASKEALEVEPPRPLDELEREQVSLWQTSLTDYVKQSTAQFILGQRSMDEWDAYVSELEQRNMGQFVDTVNEAYQRAQSGESEE